ncbi:MAG: hypothetical protein KAH30_02250, partial [Caldisericia bacterium]|nr:hypothetical protein [Caldisericia bacterium]
LFAFLAFYGMQKVLSNRKVKHWFIAITLTLIVAGILLVGISAFSVGSDTLVGVTEEVSGTVNRLQNNGFLFVGAFTLLSIVTSLQIMLNTEKLSTSIVVAAIVGTLTNTVLTLGVAVMTPGLLGDTIAQRLTTAWVIAGSNGAMEIILAIVLCLAIVPTLLNITKFTKAQIV